MPQWYGPLNRPWPPQYNQAGAWPQPTSNAASYNPFGQKLIGGQVFDAPTGQGGGATGGMPPAAPMSGGTGMFRPPSQPGALTPSFPTKPMFSPGTAPTSQAAFTPGAASLGMGVGAGRGIPPFPAVMTPSSLPTSVTAGTPAPRRTVFPGF